jgi:ribulose-5-phosphate 4-epimerase/fuculose-1-phosphate aldolase
MISSKPFRRPIITLTIAVALSGATGVAVDALSATPTESASGARSATQLEQAAIDDLVTANRILTDQGVLDAFGHVSVRDPLNPQRYLMSRSRAAGLVTAKDILVFDLDSNPVDKSQRNTRLYSERYIHGEIYKARPDVMAVIHTHSPAVVAFGVSGVALRPIHLNASFLGEQVPVFEIRDQFGTDTDLLISSPARGKALARLLGDRAVVLLRGHGDVVVGSSLPVAVWNAVYTEVDARELQQAIALGGHVTYLSPQEIKSLNSGYAAFAGRTWDLWKQHALAQR